MTPADLVTQLEDLGLNLVDLAALTGEDELRCAQWVKGSEPIPTWLDLMLAYWTQLPQTLEIARAFADPERERVN